MPSTFGSMEISKTGMLTYNAAIQTTAHNIANIETKGYSRQTVNYEALVANKSSATVQGFGVGVVDVTRERNEYYDNKYIRTQSSYNKYDTDMYYLNSLQDLICGSVTSDDKSRIMDAFDDFYSSLSNLVGNPNNLTIRTEGITRAQTLAEYIQNMGTNMQQLQDEANTEIKSCVDQINAIADKITSLNRQINVIEQYGVKANDLRDQRSLLIDELAQYAKVETLEKEGTIEKKSGRQSDELVVDTQFYVYLNGNTLVDGYRANHILYTQKETYSNICDNKGLYDLSWADGTDFVDHARSLGGKLQALFEMRDGNNSTTLEGKITATNNFTDASGKTVNTLVLKSKEGANFINDADLLNIPTHDGEIYINGSMFQYESFKADWDSTTGEYVYTFTMTNMENIKDIDLINTALSSEMKVTVGDNVQARGIPYYFAQLNEFVRTFSRRFNEIQNGGHDLYDEFGIDFFTAKTPAQGKDYVMNEDPHLSFDTSKMDQTEDASYYYMTTANYKVSQEMLSDPKKLAAKSVVPCEWDAAGNPTRYTSVGNDDWGNIQKLSELKDDSSMFLHGAPDSFIQSLASSMGVECSRSEALSKSQYNLLLAIDKNRQSVSGVDEDEEAEDLMVFQQMLMNQYKVLSVMNQVLDKLINGTAV
ncbi:MAG: flagellar hook-associated protein FlgK [Eubacterium sp.]|nr:flagellar hook-associated protein FlgK [Eubacterium sp.]